MKLFRWTLQILLIHVCMNEPRLHAFPLLPIGKLQPQCGTVRNTVLFSTPGSFNYVVPAQIRLIRVSVLGGGGGGSYGSNYAAGGGGSGGYAEKVYQVNPSDTFPIVIGSTGNCSGGIAPGGPSVSFNGTLIGCGGGSGAGGNIANGNPGSGACGGSAGIVSGNIGAGGGGGGWLGGDWGRLGSMGGTGDDLGGGGGGAGAPGRSGPGANGADFLGLFGGNGGQGAGGSVGGLGSLISTIPAENGQPGTPPNGGSGGGGSYGTTGSGGYGGIGAGTGGGYGCRSGTTGFVFIEELQVHTFTRCGGTPPAFGFTDVANAQVLGTTIASNTITLTGSFGGLTATCGPGCVGISRNGGPFQPGPVGDFSSGDTIAIQLVTGNVFNETKTATVTIGPTTSAVWNVTTGQIPFYWVGGSDLLWTNPSNWSTGVAPGAGNTARFDSNICTSNCNVTINANSAVGGVMLNSNFTGTLTQAAAVNFEVGASGWTQANGQFVSSTGQFLVNQGFLNLSQGTFSKTAGEIRFLAPPGTTSVLLSQTGTGTLATNGADLYLTHATTGCSGGQTYSLNSSSAANFNNVRLAGGHPTTNNTCTWSASNLIANGSFTSQRDFATGSIALSGLFNVVGHVSYANGTNGGSASLYFVGTANQNFSQSGGAVMPNGSHGVQKASGDMIPTTNLTFNNAGLYIYSGAWDRNSRVINGLSYYYLAANAWERTIRPDNLTSAGWNYQIGCNYEMNGALNITWYWTDGYCNILFNKPPGNSANLVGATRFRGSLTIQSGTLNVNGQSLRVDGNWSLTTGVFSHGNGTVTLGGTNQTVSGSNTFYNLIKNVTSPATLTFAAGSTTTISNTLNFTGTSGNLLSLRSSSPGLQWNITPNGGKTLQFLDVQDSNNLTVPAMSGGGTSVDSGNNTNWTLP